MQERYVALDWLRGVAMLLMALDHAAYFAQTGIQAESYSGILPDLEPLPHVLTGLFTNLASVIFFTLVGTSVAFFEQSRRKQGWSERHITRFFIVRAVILLILETTIISRIYNRPPAFDVLAALAGSLIVLAWARRLPVGFLALLGSGLFLAYPLLLQNFQPPSGTLLETVITILLRHSPDTTPAVGYPLLGRLSLTLLGYVAGRRLLERKLTLTPRRLLTAALIGFAAWFVLRLSGGYGDFLPYQPGWPLIYFFIMSKQPPSLTFQLFNLAWAAVVLAFLIRFQRPVTSIGLGHLLNILGQTALFFYVAHLLVYSQLISRLIPSTFLNHAGLLRGYLEFVLGILVLVPVCLFYRRLRQQHPHSILQYL